ncbi:hypothetical protein PDIG_28400 [Penicillium digitatum PHI26]|uniref:Uncharacterized protein n=2 Tax=Penicillium digitatum TaxID=36651 RepID=K9G1D8_PEND2|nr:hypothetical protein PDIP_62840 [Penicillium digitatum Pd1]EKV09790.1 hypothetical protein PDIP_62840 [Penicillium digitatum Pd1]EKV15159.1 hypothetical protein PDIG_28400 [Penicillium digitatum PHI26]
MKHRHRTETTLDLCVDLGISLYQTYKIHHLLLSQCQSGLLPTYDLRDRKMIVLSKS